jgi:deoxycytidylate deaminase
VCKLHAETHALLASRPGDILRIYRWSPAGKPKPSRPCKYCMGYIQQCNIKKIEYLNDKMEWVRERVPSIK